MEKKMNKNKSFKQLQNILVLLFIAIMTIIQAPYAAEKTIAAVKTTSIAKLKVINLTKANVKVIRQMYYVEGYFVNETIPMLVQNMNILQINTPMPESSYIILSGTGIDRFTKQEGAYGSFIRLKCSLKADREFMKGKITNILVCPEAPQIIKKAVIRKPILINICKKYPLLCRKPPFQFREKFALLYSGGFNVANAHLRYWNDLKFMYLTLKNKYGFNDDHIAVVYKNGTAEDTDMPVGYAASATGLSNAIENLKSKMTARDTFFLFVTNHGGGHNDGSCNEGTSNSGGRADTSGDETDTYQWDEETYYYNQTSNDLWDDDFAQLINSLSFKKMIAIFEQCYSGGFLQDLRGSNRVLISAASEFQFSWGGGPGNHDVFSYYFTCALNKTDHTGAALTTNPDTDGNGNVSILEAFLYAKSNDTKCETPLLDDNGDGVGDNSPTATGTDGQLAAKTIL